MIITTTDPITGEELEHLEFKPFVVEGTGELASKVYFESEETRRTYLQARRKSLRHNGDHYSTDQFRDPDHPMHVSP
ncbi:MAG: hypothetical protein WBO06_14210 [Gammaproteobacteria bacterium]